MALYFTREEKMALHIFGCAKLDITIGNLYGAASIATREDAKALLTRLTDRLASLSLTEKQCESKFYLAKMELVEDLRNTTLNYQKVIGDVENTYPMRNFTKAVIISTFCTDDVWKDMRAMRVLFCYVIDDKIKKIVADVIDTLEDIANNDSWKYAYYLDQYKAIVNGIRRYAGDADEPILDYIWRVEDVELE